MTRALLQALAAETKKLVQAGLYKPEKVYPSPGEAGPPTAASPIDFTSQDYLGLARDPRVIAAARQALDDHGLGVGSPRGFTGTRSVHKALEQVLAEFLGVADAAVFGSGYLANLGLYTALFDNRDCIFCDALVHPSTAEGVRLSSATAFPFRNGDLDDLEDKLKRSRSARFRAVVTDGVFPFDGRVAQLEGICQLAARYEALVIVDDSLGVGVVGQTGRGARELRGVMARVDVVTGTFGKALGGAGGGYVAGRREVVEWLRQKATPYVFSVGLPPLLAVAARVAIEILARGEAPLATLRARAAALKQGLVEADFRVVGEDHPTLAVTVGGVVALQRMVNALHERGVLVSGLCFPVVPEGQACIRLETSALHSEDDLRRVIRAFIEVGERGALVPRR
jgi:glycine C-acetyltransferase